MSLFVACVCMTEGVGGADDRYNEYVFHMLNMGDSYRTIIKAMNKRIGFPGEAYLKDHDISEVCTIHDVGSSMGWGKIRVIVINERGQGQQRFVLLVREADEDEEAYRFKPVYKEDH